jgi:hypothetical protein
MKRKVRIRAGQEDPEEEEKYKSTLSLTSTLDRVRGQGYIPAPLNPGMTQSAHHTVGWVGSRPGLHW